MFNALFSECLSCLVNRFFPYKITLLPGGISAYDLFPHQLFFDMLLFLWSVRILSILETSSISVFDSFLV